jgi:nucleoside-diphosphate-sugar epimerase
MPSACIGSNGFIGSRLKWYADNFTDEECIGITRDSYNRWRGHYFNTLIWAGGSARKDLSATELMETNCLNVYKAINDFRFGNFVYISSQAVYPSEYNNPSEESPIVPSTLSAYGLSKYLGEIVVRESCKNWVCVRPNGFSGIGLSKNVIFALTRPEPYLYYTLDSYAQYIHVDKFAQIVFFLSNQCTNEIVNVAPKEAITPMEIASLLRVPLGCIKLGNPPTVRARINTTRLHSYLARACISPPTNEEAVLYWNKALFDVKEGGNNL